MQFELTDQVCLHQNRRSWLQQYLHHYLQRFAHKTGLYKTGKCHQSCSTELVAKNKHKWILNSYLSPVCLSYPGWSSWRRPCRPHRRPHHSGNLRPHHHTPGTAAWPLNPAWIHTSLDLLLHQTSCTRAEKKKKRRRKQKESTKTAGLLLMAQLKQTETHTK